MRSKNITISFKIALVAFVAVVFSTGCKKYLDIPLPANRTAGEGAYSTDRSSAATLSHVFAALANGGIFDGAASTGYNTGLYTDELTNINVNSPTNTAFYTNSVAAANTGAMWTNLYQSIYNINLTIEGVSAATTLLRKDQWLGEAYFLRALCYFYLTNYYGDVVLVNSSDFLINKDLGRVPKADIYKQIIDDLLKSQSLLSNEYKDAAGNTTLIKGRPNKFAATALLARAYLYTDDWANAEIQASNIITGTLGTGPAYTLLPAVDIDKVFLAASAETIFALVPTGVVKDFSAYNNNMPATTTANWPINNVFARLNNSLLAAFETNTTIPTAPTDDRRKTYWTRSTTKTGAETYYFVNKYKATVVGAEFIVLLRLAEQYLIRAEARAKLNKLDEARADLDMIRNRAGLAPTNAVLQTDLVSAVLKERRIEFFTEVGHRFFDLKRTKTIDAVMSVEAPLKGVGATWDPLKQYFPISEYDISVNPRLTQTPGY